MLNKNNAGNFTQIYNDILRDERISLEAKGLYSLLKSHRVDWTFYTIEIQKSSKNGLSKTYSTLNELKKCGLLTLVKKRNKNGEFAKSDWKIHDEIDFNRSNLTNKDKSTNDIANDGVSNTKNNNSKNTNSKNKKYISKKKSSTWNRLDEQSQEKFIKAALTYSEKERLDEETVPHFITYVKSKNISYYDWGAAFKSWCSGRKLNNKDKGSTSLYH